MPGTAWVAKSLRLEKPWEGGNLNTIVLLKKHSKKMTYNDVLLYTNLTRLLSDKLPLTVEGNRDRDLQLGSVHRVGDIWNTWP